MNELGIHPVSSKEHMLNPTDIFVVAAHEDKQLQQKVAASAKKIRATTERMAYAVLIQEYSAKSLVRVRSGNTLFTIAAFEGRVGWVRSYNGDTKDNFINNIAEFWGAARKLGFDMLFMMAKTPEMVKILKSAAQESGNPEIKTKYDSKRGAFAIITGEKRD
jgi:hypothetical protein